MGGKNKVICVTLMDDLSVCNEMPSQMRNSNVVRVLDCPYGLKWKRQVQRKIKWVGRYLWNN